MLRPISATLLQASSGLYGVRRLAAALRSNHPAHIQEGLSSRALKNVATRHFEEPACRRRAQRREPLALHASAARKISCYRLHLSFRPARPLLRSRGGGICFGTSLF